MNQKIKYMVGYSGGLFGERHYIEVVANGYKDACAVALQTILQRDRHRVRSIWAEGFTDQEGVYHQAKSKKAYQVFEGTNYSEGAEVLDVESICKQ